MHFWEFMRDSTSFFASGDCILRIPTFMELFAEKESSPIDMQILLNSLLRFCPSSPVVGRWFLISSALTVSGSISSIAGPRFSARIKPLHGSVSGASWNWNRMSSSSGLEPGNLMTVGGVFMTGLVALQSRAPSDSSVGTTLFSLSV